MGTVLRNIRLCVAYDGTDYYGWQRQPEKLTVQGLLESALEKITGTPITLWGSGRTDAGVHAANQIANFKTSCPIPCGNLQKALNDGLPASVRVKDAQEVPASFHARFSAVSKTYRYRILLAPVASPFIARFVHHYPYPLDRKAMQRAAQRFEGKHDFTSFAAAGGTEEEAEDAPSTSGRPSRTNVRTISSSRFFWNARNSILVYEVSANGFLRHMVRNLAGTLIEVGRRKLSLADITSILGARDRKRSGPTAPAHGLCLWKVRY
jgi:tRNA pseudouridine38-40 synthase